MTFECFYDEWFEQLQHLLRQLNQAPRRPPANEEQNEQLSQLVQKAMSHYTEYYRVKSLTIKQDVLSVFAAPWSTTLERSLHWIAGWRPTTAFHLIYTEASIRFESQIIDILRGIRNGDLGDLLPGQFRRVSELQCETVRQENAITEELCQWQDGASELLEDCSNLEEKMEILRRIVEKADHLRLKTIEDVVEMLTPRQAVQFFIAAAEVQCGIRGWGVNHDRRRG